MSRQDLKDLIDFSKKFGLMKCKIVDVIIAYNTCKMFNVLINK